MRQPRPREMRTFRAVTAEQLSACAVWTAASPSVLFAFEELLLGAANHVWHYLRCGGIGNRGGVRVPECARCIRPLLTGRDRFCTDVFASRGQNLALRDETARATCGQLSG